MSDKSVVLTTASSYEEAQKIARELSVEKPNPQSSRRKAAKGAE
jgi:hypothetical protein